MIPVDLGTDFIPIDIEAGQDHVCALSEDKSIKCWGRNTDGQLGIGCEWNEQFGDDLPVLELPSDFVPQQMGLGGYHSCIVGTNHSNDTIGTEGMICFGYNFDGQLGYEDTTNRGDCNGTYEDISNLSIIDLGSGFEIAQIQIVGVHGCVLSTSDELKCFGQNDYGQLGYGDNVIRGDQIDEMGDYLEIVQWDFTANPTIEPS